MSRRGSEVQLVAYPHGEIATSHFRVVEVDVREPGEGEVLVRNAFTSVDPGMRLRLRASGPAGYFNSFALNAAMDGIMTVGEVVESRADGFHPGDSVWHASGWREYSTVAADVPALSGLGTLAHIDTRFAPAEKYLGPLGGMGLTAYAGIIDAAGFVKATWCGCPRLPVPWEAWPPRSRSCAGIASSGAPARRIRARDKISGGFGLWA